MALMFGAKIKTKIQTSKYSCTYLCTRHKKVCNLHAYAAPPPPPQRGSVFVFSPFVSFPIPGKTNPIKALFLL